MALFTKKFNKFIKRRRPYKGERKENPRSKRVCHNCGKNGHFIANEHMRGSKKTMTKKRSLIKATRKTRNILRRSLMIKLILAKNGTQVMRVSNCHTLFRDSETKPPYVCPECFIHTYSNNMINRCHVQ
jgi:protein-arginine kinase activator protein McsA